MNLKPYYPKKRFGQHWLINEKILETIKKTAELNSQDYILEIGPGKGALTSKLLDSSIIGLHAVELDKDLISFLKIKFSDNKNFSLRQADILNTDFDDLNYKFTKVVANIPYNITGPILDLFIGRLGQKQKYKLSKIIFLMQKEVADRIIANKGSSNVGALSTRIKLLSNVKKICDVPPSSFNPSPRVYSSLMVFQPFKSSLRLDNEIEKCIDQFLKITFNGRRKKLKNTLSVLLSLNEIEYLGKISDISFDLRPQDLSIEQWITIAKKYIKMNKFK